MRSAFRSTLAAELARTGLPQREIVRRMRARGLLVTDARISDFKFGRRRPPYEQALALAVIAGRTVEELFPHDRWPQSSADSIAARRG